MISSILFPKNLIGLIKKVKMWEKKGTLEILAKHLGLLKNKGTGASVTV
ncbi:MAG: hypothetical protein HY787_29510, partial [Deltaproteobacteria bacterium]|nr:hypothetical protein [Deltaproteobacteria bacterium]